MNIRAFLFLIVGGFWLLPLAGCRKQDEITHYTVAKDPALATSKPTAAATAGAGQDGEAVPKDRMLAAMIPHGTETWFFKVTGPNEPVRKGLRDFLALVKSVRFSGGDDAKPTWTLPEGWREEPGSGMRYATFHFGSEGKPLELTVIPLPTGPGDADQNVLANVNRWLGQLQLPPITRDQLAEKTLRIDLDGTTATLVNLVGNSGPNRMGGGAPFAPFAGGPQPERPAPGEAAEQPDELSSSLKYEKPEGWIQGKVGGMRKAAFEVHDGERKAEITAIDLPAAGNDLLPNVNRWRGQLKLEPMTAEELGREVKKIKVGQATGDYIQLTGPKTADGRKAILGVIVTAGDTAWFFKLQGDAELADREKQRFEAFVQSVKLNGAGGAGHGK